MGHVAADLAYVSTPCVDANASDDQHYSLRTARDLELDGSIAGAAMLADVDRKKTSGSISANA
jgi:hypothetical protein